MNVEWQRVGGASRPAPVRSPRPPAPYLWVPPHGCGSRPLYLGPHPPPVGSSAPYLRVLPHRWSHLQGPVRAGAEDPPGVGADGTPVGGDGPEPGAGGHLIDTPPLPPTHTLKLPIAPMAPHPSILPITYRL